MVALALVVLSASGVGTWWFGFRDTDRPTANGTNNHGGDGGPGGNAPDEQPPELAGEVDWQVEFDSDDPELAYTYDAWTTDDALIRVRNRDVIAHDLESGEEIWTMPLPDDTTVCAVAPETFGDVGVIATDEVVENEVSADRRICSATVGIDLTDGSESWRTPFPADVLDNSLGRAALHAAGEMAIVQSNDEYFAVDAASGDQLWPGLEGYTEPEGGQCVDNDLEYSRDRLIVLLHCSLFDAGDREKLLFVDPESGQIIDEFEAEKPKSTTSHLVSADPITVWNAGSELDGSEGQLTVFDDSGQEQDTISNSGDWGTLETRPRQPTSPDANLDAPPDHVIQDDLLVTATMVDHVDDDRTNKLAAIDLATGEIRWTHDLGGQHGDVIPVDIVNDQVVAIAVGDFANPPQVFAIGTEDGDPEPLGKPYHPDLSMVPQDAHLTWTGDHLLMTMWHPQGAFHQGTAVYHLG